VNGQVAEEDIYAVPMDVYGWPEKPIRYPLKEMSVAWLIGRIRADSGQEPAHRVNQKSHPKYYLGESHIKLSISG
jgi:hypothetical protein